LPKAIYLSLIKLRLGHCKCSLGHCERSEAILHRPRQVASFLFYSQYKTRTLYSQWR